MFIKIMLIYFLCISFITFLAFAADKRQAVKGGCRIPEADLMSLSILGGALGGLFGMYACHHKTRKAKFLIGLPLILAGWCAALFFLLRFLPV